MTEKASRDRLPVIAMIEAAKEAANDAGGGRDEFLKEGLTQKAVPSRSHPPDGVRGEDIARTQETKPQDSVGEDEPIA